MKIMLAEVRSNSKIVFSNEHTLHNPINPIDCDVNRQIIGSFKEGMKIEEYLTIMVIEDYDEVYQLWSLTKGIGLSGSDTKENIDAYLKETKD